ncbi:hypothetical protein RN001_015490 [Aquatica leii]|uniref:DUF8207 domain-containing protein n=1 Tax=Aquatica leii TaxID=1421715 RepID=A0AAN7P185_9COLE|nr:hypothetical protein RN001_015490 [Aquatica leii]
MSNRLKEELIRARKAVKRKADSLKADTSQKESIIQQQFKPITQPLKELLTTIKPDSEFTVKKQPDVTVSIKKQLSSNISEKVKQGSVELKSQITDQFKPSHASTPTRPSTHHTSGQPKEITFLDTDVIAHTDDAKVDNIPTLDELRSELAELGTNQAFQDYLNQYDGLAKIYVESLFRDVNNEFDHNYGVRFDPALNKFQVGDSDLEFVGEDLLIKRPSGEEFRYTGTPGLYELLFKRIPIGYKQQDQIQYKDIIIRTNATRRHYDPKKQIQAAGKKYSNIIKPLLATSMTRVRSNSTTLKEGGHIQMLQLNNKRLEFLPWKDPNKLVNWLRTLLSSKEAGHTGHTNEIIYIIDELRSAKIIK